MCSDPPDDTGKPPPKPLTEAAPVAAANTADKRTVMLRTRSKNELDDLFAAINSSGSQLISSGHGVIVIEGSRSAIEQLRNHPDVVAVDEPKPLQMRRQFNYRIGGAKE